MSDLADIAAAARSEWKTRIEVGQGIPTLYDNQDPRAFDAPATAVWARLWFDPLLGEEEAEIGAGPAAGIEHPLELRAEIRVPLGTGDGTLLSLADTAVAQFTRLRSGDVLFSRPWIGGGDREGDRWRVDLHLPARFLSTDAAADFGPAAGSASVSYAALAAALRSRVQTTVETALSVPVLYDNGPPFGSSGSPYAGLDPSASLWVRCFVVPGQPFRAELQGGRATYRTAGELVLSAFGPLGRGDGAVLALADAAGAAVAPAALPAVRLGVPRTEAGRRDGPWWRVDVACPFASDSIL